MTGVEAISNGVPAFKPPEAKNAAATLLIMAVLVRHDVPRHHAARARLPRRARASRRRSSRSSRAASSAAGAFRTTRCRPATMLILVLAANTAYADFPRLASILARDRYLPRQFMNQGDRLAFSNGIVVLSVLAGILLVAFRRRHARAHPALHDRRVRLLHAVAGRHGHALAAAAAAPGWRTQRGDQRRRRARDRHRAAGRRASPRRTRAPGSSWC